MMIFGLPCLALCCLARLAPFSTPHLSTLQPKEINEVKKVAVQLQCL
jgi:hypothetical protein